MEIGAQMPTEVCLSVSFRVYDVRYPNWAFVWLQETVACQDLGETTATSTSTATCFAGADTQHKVMDMDPDSMRAKPACELEKKKLRDEMLTEVGGACTTGDGEVSVFSSVVLLFLPLVPRYRSPSHARPSSSHFLLLS